VSSVGGIIQEPTRCDSFGVLVDVTVKVCAQVSSAALCNAACIIKEWKLDIGNLRPSRELTRGALGKRDAKRKHKVSYDMPCTCACCPCAAHTLEINCVTPLHLQDSSLSVLQQELVNKVEGGPAPIDPQVAKRRAIRKGAR